MDSKNLSVIAYREIKDMLISLHFPPGSPLREQELADMLGMSRTPIREALQRLGHEGWVQIGDKKRIVVSEVTRKDIEDLYQLRYLIEPFAAEEILKQGKGRLVAASLDEIVSDISKIEEDDFAFARMDTEFHTTIVRNVGNEKLTRFWQGLYEETSRAVVISLRSDGHAGAHDVVVEHANLVDAFWKKDRERVLKTVYLHLDKSKAAILSGRDFAEGFVSNI
ncbi:GntR family transcriptional regulator [Synergistaceae bacterium OttesenSCG-928-D05]|nr:GntR family transcriptional regulator [Synergistaceae bacterium OttesenSCG-928-D05]